MPSSLTKLGVWNLAIDIVKDTALSTTIDQAATARWLERNWAHTVETTLQSYVWNFAKQKFEISAEAANPDFGWARRYAIPPGALRVLPITEYGNRDGRIVPHEVIGAYIETDHYPPLRVTCIMDLSANPGVWTPLFVEVVRCKLALGMANKFTSKNKFIDLASQMLANAIVQAEQIDTYEGSPEPIEQHDIIRARGIDTTDHY